MLLVKTFKCMPRFLLMIKGTLNLKRSFYQRSRITVDAANGPLLGPAYNQLSQCVVDLYLQRVSIPLGGAFGINRDYYTYKLWSFTKPQDQVYVAGKYELGDIAHIILEKVGWQVEGGTTYMLSQLTPLRAAHLHPNDATVR